jgi:glycine dehydrogenase
MVTIRPIAEARAAGAVVIFVADPLALTIMETPASLGADIAVGSMQRFGVPMGFGGPHAAYCAVSDKAHAPHARTLSANRSTAKAAPATGSPCRRASSTSAATRRPPTSAPLRRCSPIWRPPMRSGMDRKDCKPSPAMPLAGRAARQGAAEAKGVKILGKQRFDTVTVKVTGKSKTIAEKAEQDGRLFRMINEDLLGITFDETSTDEDLKAIAKLFGATVEDAAERLLPGKPREAKSFLTQPVFHQDRSETQMMRFLRKLADKDLALDRTMIPLGSCTMKLNAAAEMIPSPGRRFEHASVRAEAAQARATSR